MGWAGLWAAMLSVSSLSVCSALLLYWLADQSEGSEASPQKWRNSDWSRLNVSVTDGHRQPLRQVNTTCQYVFITIKPTSTSGMGTI